MNKTTNPTSYPHLCTIKNQPVSINNTTEINTILLKDDSTELYNHKHISNLPLNQNHHDLKKDESWKTRTMKNNISFIFELTINDSQEKLFYNDQYNKISYKKGTSEKLKQPQINQGLSS